MLSSQRALFGGALLAAGLAGRANAQFGTFIFQDQDVTGSFSSYAYSYAYGSGNFDQVFRPNRLNTSSTSPGAGAYGPNTVTTSQNYHKMRTTATLSPAATAAGYGFSRIQQFFRVTQDTQLSVQWDIRATDGFVSGFLLESATGTQLWTLNPAGAGSDPPQGRVTINLFAGTDYTALFGFKDQSSGFGPFLTSLGFENFIQMKIVPTPGAAGIFGMAGLIAVRRRRRA